MSQPDPNAFFIQVASAASIASRLYSKGVLGINPLKDVEQLLLLDDPILKRLGYVIKIAGEKYGTSQAKPFGYYACIAIHNSAIAENWDCGWNGTSVSNPYGAPNTPA